MHVVRYSSKLYSIILVFFLIRRYWKTNEQITLFRQKIGQNGFAAVRIDFVTRLSDFGTYLNDFSTNFCDFARDLCDFALVHVQLLV